MKSPFTDCSKCPLHDQSMIVGETNCPEDLSSVELLFVAEAPATQELKRGRPLIGKAGQIWRTGIDITATNTLPYYATNCCLCANIVDNKTKTPPQEAIDCCMPNLDKLIDVIQPKLIVVMGGISKDRFGIGGSMTSAQGDMFKYRNYDLLITWHPQYIGYNGGIKQEKGREFCADLSKAYTIITGKELKTKTVKKVETQNITEPHHYQYPDWMFSDKIYLVEVQRFKDKGQVCFIFRDENGEKKYHSIVDTEYYYYRYPQSEFMDSPMVVPSNEVEVVIGEPIGEKNFESDVRTELKHSVDYYYQRKKRNVDELFQPLKIMYFDIEVYNDGRRDFPDPKKAEQAINAISFKLDDGPVNVYIAKVTQKMDPSKVQDIPTNTVVKFFPGERELLNEFCKQIKELNPDLMSGWHTNGFDWPTIFGRMKVCQIPISNLSPLKKAYANVKRYNDFYIGGIHCIDQLETYKELTFSVEESYSLAAITTKVLKNKTKVAFTGSLDDIYEKDITGFIEYSCRDTELLYDLEKKLGHIGLKNELRRVCSSTWKNTETTTGMIDPLCIAYAKDSNLICRDAAGIKTDDKIIGAYVRVPIPGLHAWLVDFDYTSLYPSIICSMNIGPNTFVAKIDKDIATDYIYGNDIRTDEFDITYDPMKGSFYIEKISEKKFDDWITKNKYIVTTNGCIYKSHKEKLSFFYMILKYLLDSRTKYKDKMKDAKTEKRDEDFKYYFNIQSVYKILANSLYGVLANTGFRFFNHDLAQTVTLTGQESIKFIGHHVGHYMKTGNKEINPKFLDDYEDQNIPYLLYTDTDSIFLQMGDWLMDRELLD